MTSIPDNDPTRLLADLDFVRSLARQLCRDEHVAEDIAQQTLTAAIDKPPRKAGNWRGWLATVTRNLVRKHHRSERRLKEREARASRNDVAPSTDEVVQREQSRAAVVQAVLALPERYRKVVLLHHYNGLDLAGCARSLGIPASTVRTQLARALQLLRKHLDDSHDGDRNRWLAALMPFTAPLGELVASATTNAATSAALTTHKKAIVVAAAIALSLGVVAWTQTRTTAPAPAPLGTRTATAAMGGDLAKPDQQPRRNQSTHAAAARVAATATTDEAWVVTGSVTATDERPIAAAHVHIWANVGEQFDEDHRISLGTVQTNRDGAFAAPLAGVREFTPIVRSQLWIYASADARGFRPEIAGVTLDEILAGSNGGKGKLDIGLSEETLVKGRVVDPAGQPVYDAVVIQISREGSHSVATERDGTFAFESPDPNESGTHLLIAQHQKHGRSQPFVLRSDQLSEVRVPDLVLDDPGQRITGRVHFPDGKPASGLDISIVSVSDEPSEPKVFHGFEVENYDELFYGGFHGGTETETDEEGRFVMSYVRPGPYEIDVDGDLQRRLVVPHGQSTTHADIEYDVKSNNAQIHVRLEDENGIRLADAFYGFHRWRGAAADAALARFDAEGATPALLATADKHESMFDGNDEFIDSEPDSFTIFESCFHGAGPTYAGCRLEANQHRGSVVIVLKPRTKTGSVQITMRDESGAALDPVWFRMCRIPTRSGLPIFFPGKATSSLPPSIIPGPWHRVPKNGRIYDVPAGPVTVEVLAAPGDRIASTRSCRYPVQTYDISVPANGSTSIVDRVQEGAPIVVELLAPETGHDERVANLRPMIGVTYPSGGRTMWFQLLPADGSKKPIFRNGRCLVRTQAKFVAGTYHLRYHPSLDLQRFEMKEDRAGKWQAVPCKWRRFDATIALSPTAPTTVIQIARQ